MNEGWSARGRPNVEPIGRNDLIPRFVGMSDTFWPEKPADIRDFFSFYLAEGCGDFDPKKFGDVLRGLLPLCDEAPRRKAQRLASLGLLGNYLLNPFEREGDHWSLFRGWTMIAAHQAWFAERAALPARDWRPSFDLAKDAARERLLALSVECLAPNAFKPKEIESDDYTRARNLVLAGVLAVTDLIGADKGNADPEQVKQRVEMLLQNQRLIVLGECDVPFLLAIQWYVEKRAIQATAIDYLQAVISEICQRNHTYAEDDCFPPPLVSANEILADLFTAAAAKERNRRCPGTWSLETLVDFLARRNHRIFLTEMWRNISRLDMMSFQPQPAVDGLLWDCPEGHEAMRKPGIEQGWAKLVARSVEDKSATLPAVLRSDRDFALMFLLAHPHRLSPALVGSLEQEDRRSGSNR